MSRIGNKPITVPEGVEVTLNEKVITVKGPKGTFIFDISPFIIVITSAILGLLRFIIWSKNQNRKTNND